MALTKINANSYSTLDATKLTGNLPAISGASLTGVGKIGQLLQSETNSATTISSTTYATISLSQAITPSASSSKVLIMGYVKYSVGTSNTDRGFGIRIRRDSTAIQTSTTLYDLYHKSTNSDFIDGGRFPFMYIDSPSSSSAITYSVYVGAWNNLSVTINPDSNKSQIQCWEILA
tara:strand:+ start:493 stop:1017 length:525 start_codon:yes stop_codon:yes gene_type:complete